ncbi:MAG: chloride channel protein [Chloroflexota bacterium]|nr:MAG: chloride channel protein [Chloroflexota bacterium]
MSESSQVGGIEQSPFFAEWSRRVTRRLNRSDIPESGIIILTALIVGVGAGLGAVVFRRLIQWITHLSFTSIAGFLDPISPFQYILIPAVGGLIVGVLIYKFAQEAKGHGVPEVMEAVALRGGRIRPRVALVKALASSICIGTGGSVGREGPIAQIGSALGSTVGQLLNLSDERVRNLVACGAAGGIAATFNAPIAGSLFALEVILGQFHATYFGAVVVSSVTADVIAQYFEGNLRAFIVPVYSLVSPWELLFYAIMGVIAALAAVLFSRSLYASEDLFDKLHLPEYIKPALGGALLGVLGILTYKSGDVPRIFGVGYESITESLSNNFTIQITFALLLIKMLATLLTLGSGGSGGVFAPSLFMGAMLGATFGQVVNLLFPEITAPPGAYALVGMAAFFGGAAHAPVTAILILFEMTGDYQIILPLMLATVVSTFISRIISRDSIYTLKLTRRGVHLEQGQDIDVMQGVQVKEIMTTDTDYVLPDAPLSSLAEVFDQTHHHGLPVCDKDGNLVAIVTIQDLEKAISGPGLENRVVMDIATKEDLQVTYPEESVWEALRRLSIRDVGRLPVLESRDSRRLVGIIRRYDIVRAYKIGIINRSHHQYKSEILKLGKLDDATFLHLLIPENAEVHGKRVKDITLPDECLIVSVQRGRRQHVVHGNTVIHAGDRITVFTNEDSSPAVRERLTALQQVEEKQDPQVS